MSSSIKCTCECDLCELSKILINFLPSKMSRLDCLYLLIPLLFTLECLSVNIFLSAPSRLVNARESEISQLWPVCLLNNEWTPCPGKPLYYNRRTRKENYNKPHLYQKFPYYVKEAIKVPISIAADVLHPILNSHKNNRELKSYNDRNIVNNYSMRPRFVNSSYTADIPTATDNYPASPDTTDNYYTFLNVYPNNSKTTTDYAAISSHFLDRMTKPVSENLIKATEMSTNIRSSQETTTQYMISTTNSDDSSALSPINNNIEETTEPAVVIEDEQSHQERKEILLKKFMNALDFLDRGFYNTTFNKLLAISSPERVENGISFVQSGLFLGMFLMALSADMTDTKTTAEVDAFIGFNSTDEEKAIVIKEIISTLPKADNDLRWLWSSRLVLGSKISVVNNSVTEALQLKIAHCNENDSPEELSKILNHMIEDDSGGAIHDTFEPDDLSDGFRAAAITTLYFRARWRSAPTVLNGTRLFRDTRDSPERSVRMIRINDVMRYAKMDEWGCQAIEISYITPGLTLLLLVPDRTSLRSLAHQITISGISEVTRRLESIRIAVSMPIYTLRMTLLLPSKLESMGVKGVVDWNNTDSGLRLSHAIQRIMFWAEAGRNAFKDDGIEWDLTPELELVVDRPYLFFVRWHNLTLMNGNFVL